MRLGAIIGKLSRQRSAKHMPAASSDADTSHQYYEHPPIGLETPISQEVETKAAPQETPSIDIIVEESAAPLDASLVMRATSDSEQSAASLLPDSSAQQTITVEPSTQSSAHQTTTDSKHPEPAHIDRRAKQPMPTHFSPWSAAKKKQMPGRVGATFGRTVHPILQDADKSEKEVKESNRHLRHPPAKQNSEPAKTVAAFGRAALPRGASEAQKLTQQRSPSGGGSTSVRKPPLARGGSTPVMPTQHSLSDDHSTRLAIVSHAAEEPAKEKSVLLGAGRPKQSSSHPTSPAERLEEDNSMTSRQVAQASTPGTTLSQATASEALLNRGEALATTSDAGQSRQHAPSEEMHSRDGPLKTSGGSAHRDRVLGTPSRAVSGPPEVHFDDALLKTAGEIADHDRGAAPPYRAVSGPPALQTLPTTQPKSNFAPQVNASYS